MRATGVTASVGGRSGPEGPGHWALVRTPLAGLATSCHVATGSWGVAMPWTGGREPWVLGYPTSSNEPEGGMQGRGGHAICCRCARSDRVDLKLPGHPREDT